MADVPIFIDGLFHMESNLTYEQSAVVLSEERRILCLAGAGTGKTHTMLSRINRIAQETNNPSSILVLTFTNAAAYEMQSRYDCNFKESPEFRTFHSFCYNLIVNDRCVREKIGYKNIPDIADDSYIKYTSEIVNRSLGLKQSKVLPELSEKVDFHRKLRSKAIKQKMITDNKISFSDLCSSVCNLFVENDESIRKYKSKYKYIFVDEFQDTDDTQYKFVESFSESSIFLIGDAMQCLYTFRGADSSILKRLAVDPDWQVLKLTKNFRSKDQICSFANKITERLDGPYRFELHSDSPGGFVDVKEVSKKFYKQSVEEFLKSFQFPEDCAILCRTNREVQEVAEFFRMSNIEFHSKDEYSDKLKYIEIFDDDDKILSFLSSKLTHSEYSRYLKNSFLKLSKGAIYRPYDLVEDFPSVIETYQILQCLRSIQETSENFLEDSCRYLEIPYNNEIDLKELSKSVNSNKSGPYVGTVHSVKGLEFDCVIVLGVNTSSFNLTSEDNLYVYYVAVTRAKKSLYVLKV